MALVRINWEPEDRQLRQFGQLCLVLFPLLAWSGTAHASMPIRQGWTVALAMVGALLAVVGTVCPQRLRLLYLGLCLAVHPLGVLTSEIILLLLFYGVFTPLAVLFRVLGRDALQRQFDPQAQTYWEPRQGVTSPSRYFRQY